VTASTGLIGKGLIFVGARPGGRNLPAARICNHPLVPIANKPLLFYTCESLRDAGVDSAVVVMSPEIAPAVRSALDDEQGCGLKVSYLDGEEPHSLGHAIMLAERFLHGAPFIACSAYGLLRQGLRPFAEVFVRDRPEALLLFQRRSEVSGDRIIELDGGRRRPLAKRLLESCDAAPIGAGLFGPKIFEAIRQTEQSGARRPDVTEAVERLLDTGARAQAELVDGWWEHRGDAGELLEANRLVLDDIVTSYAVASLHETRIQGRVRVDPSARLECTMIRGPVTIGPRAHVIDSYIGPNTAIGEGAVIEGAEIEHSIILPGAVIKHLGRRLEASVVGREARVIRDFALPKALRVQVGDGAEISLA
jgi:glucose-1-phosphate thymidylyltransferase